MLEMEASQRLRVPKPIGNTIVEGYHKNKYKVGNLVLATGIVAILLRLISIGAAKVNADYEQNPELYHRPNDAVPEVWYGDEGLEEVVTSTLEPRPTLESTATPPVTPTPYDFETNALGLPTQLTDHAPYFSSIQEKVGYLVPILSQFTNDYVMTLIEGADGDETFEYAESYYNVWGQPVNYTGDPNYIAHVKIPPFAFLNFNQDNGDDYAFMACREEYRGAIVKFFLDNSRFYGVCVDFGPDVKGFEILYDDGNRDPTSETYSHPHTLAGDRITKSGKTHVEIFWPDYGR